MQKKINIKLIKGDCLKKMKELDNNSIDLVLTDPPYNLSNFMKKRETNLSKMRDNYFGGAGWDDLNTDEWLKMMDSLLNECSRVMKKGSALIMFMAVIKVESIIKIAEKYGFYYKTTGTWHKTNPMPRNMKLHFINSTESWIYFIYKNRTGTFNNNGVACHDFFETSVATKKEKEYGKHPTQKPEKLIEEFIRILSNKNDLILDPFMGSGTTGVCAKRAERKFIGIEKNTEYFEIAKKRIEETKNGKI